jgi:hypothetical protein
MAWGGERIPCAENEDLIFEDKLQFSGDDKIRLIPAPMRVAGRETDIEKATGSCGIGGDRNRGSDAHVDVIAPGFRLKFDWWRCLRRLEDRAWIVPLWAALMTLNKHYQSDVGRVGFHKTWII